MISFHKGLTEKQINQLIEYTNTDPDISKYTGDINRFKDRDTYNKWLSLKRTIYTLMDEQDNLVGIVWVGNYSLPEDKNYISNFNHQDYGVTFAIRIYGDARGKGLAQEFIKKSLNNFKPKKKVWLDTKADNFRAIKLYEKLGYRIVTSPDKNNIIIMIS